MTPDELQQFHELNAEIVRLEAELKTAVDAKHELARVLYGRYGRSTIYRIDNENWVVAPTKIGTYYFVRRMRWSPNSEGAKASNARIDRIAALHEPPRQPELAPEPEPKHRKLPIVGDVDQAQPAPEPRLMQIREPQDPNS
jgi:hypothetical protein